MAMAAAPSLSRAHVVMGTTTVRLLTLQSDLVARVRIVDPERAFVLEDPPLRETIVVAEILEALKGGHSEKQLRFVQRGHGVVRYAKREEVILFVRRIERNPELANSRLAKHLDWVSEQESGTEFRLDDETRDDITAAVRAYATLENIAPEARPDALRRITIDMLGSPRQELAGSALRDLVLSKNASIVSSSDLPVLESILDSPATAIGVRVGLLAELERRHLVDAPSRWAALIQTTRGAERLAVVRAAGAHPSEAVTKALGQLLSSDDVQLMATTAVALGGMRNDMADGRLAALLASDEPRLRMAAIRGLGRAGTAAALQTLSKAAESHRDAETRRRARAEVKVLTGGREATRGGGTGSR
jgi:hypothetical protein